MAIKNTGGVRLESDMRLAPATIAPIPPEFTRYSCYPVRLGCGLQSAKEMPIFDSNPRSWLVLRVSTGAQVASEISQSYAATAWQTTREQNRE